MTDEQALRVLTVRPRKGPLSVRARKAINRLLEGGLRASDFYDGCAPQVAKLTAARLLEVKNCGVSTVHEIREWLAYRGLSLAQEPPPSYDGLTANVYADWLEEQGEAAAAAKLRAAFPLDLGRVGA